MESEGNRVFDGEPKQRRIWIFRGVGNLEDSLKRDNPTGSWSEDFRLAEAWSRVNNSEAGSVYAAHVTPEEIISCKAYEHPYYYRLAKAPPGCFVLSEDEKQALADQPVGHRLTPETTDEILSDHIA